MFYESFPKELNKELQDVLKIIPKETYNNVSIGYSENVIAYSSHDNIIKIPYRMYFVDVDATKVDDLTDIQKEMLYCIYTRSSNGYIREKYLNKLLKLHFNDWVIPFIVKLCDEYVVEILEDIYNGLKDRDNNDIKNFCLENKAIINKSYSRMISYWNEYYRNKELHFHKYIGRKLFRECLGYDKTFEKTISYQMDNEEFDTSDLAWLVYKIFYGVDFKIEEAKDRQYIEFVFENKKINMSGDTDFNFGQGWAHSISSKFEKYLGTVSKEYYFLYKTQLKICKKMYKSILNISLMPQTGNLQSVKKGIGNDRLDTFIWALDSYYKGETSLLFNYSSFENTSYLKDYLDLFKIDGSEAI